MPSTITTYYTFQPATKARSSQVNTNFSNYRGDMLPINENTASASDNSHYLGAPDHYWAGAYVGSVHMRGATTTLDHTIETNTGLTTGGFNFLISGATIATFGASGMANFSIEPTARTFIAVTYTANGSFTIPAGNTQISVIALGGGGGGGGAGQTSSAYGASGGYGAYPFHGFLAVSAGNVLSITIGLGGAGGSSSATGGGNSGSAGQNTIIELSGNTLFTAVGGPGGQGSQLTPLSPSPTYISGRLAVPGGIGGSASGIGFTGTSSQLGIGGDPGINGGSFASGGGGGGGYGGKAGAGGIGTTGANAVGVSPTTTCYGGGGGGAGGKSSASGASGSAGIVILYYTKTT